MSKDPALLFYTSDFLTGTMFMTDEQVGKYIRLLCAQHQHGGLIDKASFNMVVGNTDIIRNKFIETEGGFYNERLNQESDRRKRFCESRKKSRTSNVRQTYVQRMETETETETVIDNIKEKKNIFKIPTIAEVSAYCKERKNSVNSQQFIDFYTAKDWMIGKNKMKDWKAAIRTWEGRNGFGTEKRAEPKPPEYKPVSESDRNKLDQMMAETRKKLKIG